MSFFNRSFIRLRNNTRTACVFLGGVAVSNGITSTSIAEEATEKAEDHISPLRSYPSDWTTHVSEEGFPYEHNSKTGEWRWKTPYKWRDNWDFRETEPSKKGIIHQIILIRHGQYTTTKVAVTSADGTSGKVKKIEALTELGREQARVTGERLRELLISNSVAPVKGYYFSTMPRARETSDIILSSVALPSDVEASPCSMIREGAVCRTDPRTNTNWLPLDESFDKDNTRALAAFKTYFKRALPTEEESYSTVLVCHGNMIRYLVMKALQLPPEAWTRLRVYNGSVTILDIRSDGVVTLKALGDTGHFQPALITDNDKTIKFKPTAKSSESAKKNDQHLQPHGQPVSEDHSTPRPVN